MSSHVTSRSDAPERAMTSEEWMPVVVPAAPTPDQGNDR